MRGKWSGRRADPYSRVSSRARDYLQWRFPGLHALGTSRQGRMGLLAILALLALAAGYGLAGLFGQPSLSQNGLLDNVLSSLLEIGCVVLVVWMTIRFRVASFSDADRFDARLVCNQDGWGVLRFPSDLRAVALDCSAVGHLVDIHPLVHASLRFMPADMDEVFRIHAGGLDVPKLGLLGLEMKAGTLTLRLGSVSYHSVFFTHYFPDYPLSRESVNEGSQPGVSLRALFGTPARRHIETELARFRTDGRLDAFPFFPNPLGVSGVCEVQVEGETRYILRQRDAQVIGDANALDWSFSGLIECHAFLGGSGPSMPSALEALCAGEIADEIFLGKAPDVRLDLRAAGMIFNEKNLFQPELIVRVCLSGPSLHAHLVRPGLRLLTLDEILALDRSGALGKKKAMFNLILDMLRPA